MRGITEESLRHVMKMHDMNDGKTSLIFSHLFNECTELNAWQPIERIDWEIEEGCCEYENDQGSSQISIMGRNNVYMHGEFNFNEIQSTFAKIQELPEDPK